MLGDTARGSGDVCGVCGSVGWCACHLVGE